MKSYNSMIQCDRSVLLVSLLLLDAVAIFHV